MTTQTNKSRMGIHYFPDSNHYRQEDIDKWLPKIQSVGAEWLTLAAPMNRAIPEQFLRGLINAGIEPVLQFSCQPDEQAPVDELEVLLRSYANWGVKYVCMFEAPNLKENWTSSSWVQNDLVNRFVDVFVPLANLSVKFGLTPIFPALEPGGDYWDTAFLRSALNIMQQAGQSKLLDRMVLGVKAWAGDASLVWGAGGPERWPGARPYFTPDREQDQIGFRIYDWYAAISQAELGRTLPMIIMSAGSMDGRGKFTQETGLTPEENATRNLQMAKIMCGDLETLDEDVAREEIPDEVLSCNFWLLAHEGCCPDADTAWFESDGQPNEIGRKMIKWHSNQPVKIFSSAHVPAVEEKVGLRVVDEGADRMKMDNFDETTPEILEEENIVHSHSKPEQLISHYLLLPIYDWGVADWHLDIIRPFVKKYRPTVGYSLDEAARADRVTVIGGKKYFPEETIDALKLSAKNVEQIVGDGTIIATQLENL